MEENNEEKNTWWRRNEQHRVLLAMDFWVSVGYVESDFLDKKTWEKALLRGPLSTVKEEPMDVIDISESEDFKFPEGDDLFSNGTNLSAMDFDMMGALMEDETTLSEGHNLKATQISPGNYQVTIPMGHGTNLGQYFSGDQPVHNLTVIMESHKHQNQKG